MIGVFLYHNWRGGGGEGLFFIPPPNLKSYWTDLQNSNGFRRPEKFTRGDPTSLTSELPMTPQVNPTSICLTIWHVWLCRTLQPCQMEKKSINKHGSCPGHLFRSNLSKVPKSKMSNWKFLGLGGWYDTHHKANFKECKTMDLNNGFERPKSEKDENRENTEIPGNSVKSGHFYLQKSKTRPFSRYQREILDLEYILGRVVTYFSLFTFLYLLCW